MILGIPSQMWETFGWIALFGVGFFLAERHWRPNLAAFATAGPSCRMNTSFALAAE